LFYSGPSQAPEKLSHNGIVFYLRAELYSALAGGLSVLITYPLKFIIFDKFNIQKIFKE